MKERSAIQPLLQREHALLKVLEGHTFQDPSLQAWAQTLRARHESVQVQLLQALTNGKPEQTAERSAESAVWTRVPTAAQKRPTQLSEALPEASTASLRPGEALLVASQPRSPTVQALVFETASAFVFEPGQYVNLTLEVESEALSRPYSIARRLEQPTRVELWVKHVLTGQLSPRLVALPLGTRVELSAARGKLRLHAVNAPSQPLFFVATGTGMSPLYALLERLATQGHAGPVEVLWGVREPAEAFALPELEALRSRLPALRIQLAVSSMAGPGVPPTGQRVTDLLLRWPVELLRQAAFHLAGNGQMIEQVLTMLERMGTPATQLHHEAFFSR